MNCEIRPLWLAVSSFVLVCCAACGSSQPSAGSGVNAAAGAGGMAGTAGTGFVLTGSGGSAGASGAGSGGAPLLGVPSRRRIAAGDRVTCALGSQGVTCWGSNLGAPATSALALSGSFQNVVLGGSGFQTVCGLEADGTTTCADWQGGNDINQIAACLPARLTDIAIDRRMQQFSFIDQAGQVTTQFNGPCSPLAPPPGITSPKRVWITDGYTCALGAQGQAYCWDIGDSALEPSPSDDFVALAVGETEYIGLNTAGKVRDWNYLGTENTIGFALVASGNGSPPIVQLESDGSDFNVCVLYNDGHTLCASTFGIDAPKAPFPEGELVTEIAVGEFHVCGIRGDDSVICAPLGCTDCASDIAPPAGFTVVPP